MHRYAAFLRGMNLGRRRITNEELCRHFSALGFDAPEAFLASGNVIFGSPRASSREIEEQLASGLEAALAYRVPTFVRSAEEVLAISSHKPFSDAELSATTGKLQVALLVAEPTPEAGSAALALATPDDRLALRGRELYWLPRIGVADSGLDFKLLEAALGPTTVRIRRTFERIAVKYFGG